MKIVRLPEAGRDEQLEYWGVEPNFRVPMDDAKPTAGVEEIDFLTTGGWHVADGDKGFERAGGLTVHRGVLSEDEKEVVDWDTLQSLAESELGFTVAEADEVFASKAGPPSKQTVVRRSRMEERLLSIQEDGGNMTILASVLGWQVDEDGKCQKMQRALRRAREARNG